MRNDKRFLAVLLIGGFAAFGALVVLTGQGELRQTSLYYPETVRQSVAFEEIDGDVVLRGTSGVSGINPDLITRTGFIYVLEVTNNGDRHHRLYIEGLNVQTDLLVPGQNDNITISPTEEGVYAYYDKRERLHELGRLEVRTVVPSDEFEGPLKDLI